MKSSHIFLFLALNFVRSRFLFFMVAAAAIVLSLCHRKKIPRFNLINSLFLSLSVSYSHYHSRSPLGPLVSLSSFDFRYHFQSRDTFIFMFFSIRL